MTLQAPPSVILAKLTAQAGLSLVRAGGHEPPVVTRDGLSDEILAIDAAGGKVGGLPAVAVGGTGGLPDAVGK